MLRVQENNQGDGVQPEDLWEPIIILRGVALGHEEWKPTIPGHFEGDCEGHILNIKV